MYNIKVQWDEKWFSEKVSKIGKPVARVTRTKEKIQINKIRDKKRH
jgi:hypothetical protein